MMKQKAQNVRCLDFAFIGQRLDRLQGDAGLTKTSRRRAPGLPGCR